MQKSPIQFYPEVVLVYIKYGENLSKLTGKHEETLALKAPAYMDNLVFALFEIYPEVLERALPGTLVQKINGGSVDIKTPLATGDFVELDIIDWSEYLNNLKYDLEKVLKRKNAHVSFDLLYSKIYKSPGLDFEEEMKEEIDLLAGGAESEEERDWLIHHLWKLWSALPHESLKNMSVIEKVHKELVDEFRSIESKSKKKKSKNSL